MLCCLNGLTCLLASSLVSASFAAPVEWSPNGQWLAYAIHDAGSTSILAEGWLTSPTPTPAPSASTATATATATAPSTTALRPSAGYRVWASRLGAAPESVLIEQSRWPLSSPSWSSDGRTLVFGRFVPASRADEPPPIRGRYEAVVQSGLGQDRKKAAVVVADLALDADDLAEVVHLKPTVSPDGRYLAAPRPGKAPGVVIVRLDTGATVKTIEGARNPSWAPDGLRLLFVQETRLADGAVVRVPFVLNRDLGSPRQLPSDRVLLDAPPVWALDGQSIFAVAQPPPALARNVHFQVDLCNLGLGSASARPVITLESVARTLQPNQGGGRLGPPRVGPRGAAPPVVLRTVFSLDRDQNDCIAMVETGGQPQALRWCNVRNQRVAKLLNPLDLQISIGAPAISPDGQAVAFRAEAPGRLGLPAVCDLNTEAVTLVAPDESTRKIWLELLASRSAEIMKTWIETRVGREPAALATILPSPLDLIGVEPTQHRLRRLAGFADGLLNQPPPAVADDADDPPALRDLAARDEVRLFFDYLRGDFRSAESRLDAVEARAVEPGARLRWLGLRAQILIGQGEIERARGISTYITRATRTRSFAVEETPAGPRLTVIPDPDADWAAQLALSLAPGASATADGRIGLDPTDPSPLGPSNTLEMDPFNHPRIDAPPQFPLLPNAPDPGIGGFDPGQFGGRMLVEPPAPRFLPDPGLDPPALHDGLIPPRL